jgi:hypothetical protein
MSHHENPQDQDEREVDEGRSGQERNSAIAIGLLAALVVLILVAMASGATGMFHP